MILTSNPISRKFFFIIALAIFSCYKVQSQIPYVKSDGEKIELSDFRGTPYLEEEFKQGVVYDGLTGKERVLFLRYDALNDVFEMKNSKTGENKEFLKKAFELHVVLNNKKFYYQNYKNDDGFKVEGYLQEIAEIGDKKFYMKYGKKLVMPQKARTSLEQDRPGKIKNNTYYVSGTASKLEATEINKKNILDNISDSDKAEAKAYIKKEKLRFKDYGDIEKLANYLKETR